MDIRYLGIPNSPSTDDAAFVHHTYATRSEERLVEGGLYLDEDLDFWALVMGQWHFLPMAAYFFHDSAWKPGTETWGDISQYGLRRVTEAPEWMVDSLDDLELSLLV